MNKNRKDNINFDDFEENSNSTQNNNKVHKKEKTDEVISETA
jgi:hypothetical protein